jgi:hypothetical protein
MMLPGMDTITKPWSQVLLTMSSKEFRTFRLIENGMKSFVKNKPTNELTLCSQFNTY